MKVRVSRVPNGLDVTVWFDTAKVPVHLLIRENDLEVFLGLLRTAMAAKSFTFEYEVR